MAYSLCFQILLLLNDLTLYLQISIHNLTTELTLPPWFQQKVVQFSLLQLLLAYSYSQTI